MRKFLTALHILTLSTLFGASGLLAQDMSTASSSMDVAQNVQLKSEGQNVLVLPETITPSAAGEAIVLDFSDISIDAPIDGYYEIYLVTQAAGEEIGTGHYAGNLTFFGLDEPQSQMNNSQAVDVTQIFHDIAFEQNGVAIMLQPALSTPTNGQAEIGQISVKFINSP